MQNCILEFIVTDLSSVRKLLSLSKSFNSRVKENDIWIKVCFHAGILKSVIRKYLERYQENKGSIFFYLQFQNMRAESNLATWMKITNELYYFDRVVRTLSFE